MDGLQQFVEQRVSDTVLDKLEKSNVVNVEQEDEQRKIHALITESVGSAFKAYKTHVNPQNERIIELHEEPEQISGLPDWDVREDDAATSSSMSQVSTVSPSNSTVSIDIGEFTVYSSPPMHMSLINDAFISNSPERMGTSGYPSLCTPFIGAQQGLIESNFAREHPFVPKLIGYPHDDNFCWLGDPAYYDHECHNEFQGTAEDGSVGFGAATFQP